MKRIVVIAILCTACARASPRIMTWTEYGKRSVSWPYIVRGETLYYGANHTYNAEDPQVAEIQKLWSARSMSSRRWCDEARPQLLRIVGQIGDLPVHVGDELIACPNRQQAEDVLLIDRAAGRELEKNQIAGQRDTENCALNIGSLCTLDDALLPLPSADDDIDLFRLWPDADDSSYRIV
jgi:hypothetical protein